MEFMLDTLNLDEIKKWSAILPLAGVTSNPSIAKKEGQLDFFKRIQAVREIIGEGPSIHIQVVATDVSGILEDARKIRANTQGNISIKVPVTPAGLTAIKQLKLEGYQVTATAIYSVFQGYLAIAAGADYLAPYYNRMENLNIKSDEVIACLSEEVKRQGASSKILAASFKNVNQVNQAIAAGSHAITAGADIFEAAFAHPALDRAVQDFAKDWEISQGRLSI